eukprot:362748-Chlamydomonas_euryale.AAC.6
MHSGPLTCNVASRAFAPPHANGSPRAGWAAQPMMPAVHRTAAAGAAAGAAASAAVGAGAAAAAGVAGSVAAAAAAAAAADGGAVAVAGAVAATTVACMQHPAAVRKAAVPRHGLAAAVAAHPVCVAPCCDPCALLFVGCAYGSVVVLKRGLGSWAGIAEGMIAGGGTVNGATPLPAVAGGGATTDHCLAQRPCDACVVRRLCCSDKRCSKSARC